MGPTPLLARPALGRLLCLPLAFLLAACQPAAAPPGPALAATAAPATATFTPRFTDDAPVAPLPSRRAPAPSPAVPTGATASPTPILGAAGLRPVAVRTSYPPQAAPTSPVEWRPPPYAVPHAFHPDDHYWLIRPLPSGTRNYDLDYYPYGSDVLLPQYGPYRIHHGSDFPNPKGTPILAAGDGTVIHAGQLPSARNGVNYYGNTVIIQHDWEWQGQPVYTLYAHTLELFVEEGDHVFQGQLIAGVGESGEVSGPHLHLEVRVGHNTYWDTRNPLLWMAPYEGWGTVAGRFVDTTGRAIPGADVTLRLLEDGAPSRRVRTYQAGVDPDETWDENFVVGDVPAGRYSLDLSINGRRFRRTLDVLPGQTNFVVISADFRYVPPTPTPTPTPTRILTGTLTAPLDGTPTLLPTPHPLGANAP